MRNSVCIKLARNWNAQASWSSLASWRICQGKLTSLMMTLSVWFIFMLWLETPYGTIEWPSTHAETHVHSSRSHHPVCRFTCTPSVDCQWGKETRWCIDTDGLDEKICKIKVIVPDYAYLNVIVNKWELILNSWNSLFIQDTRCWNLRYRNAYFMGTTWPWKP